MNKVKYIADAMRKQYECNQESVSELNELFIKDLNIFSKDKINKLIINKIIRKSQLVEFYGYVYDILDIEDISDLFRGSIYKGETLNFENKSTSDLKIKLCKRLLKESGNVDIKDFILYLCSNYAFNTYEREMLLQDFIDFMTSLDIDIRYEVSMSYCLFGYLDSSESKLVSYNHKLANFICERIKKSNYCIKDTDFIYFVKYVRNICENNELIAEKIFLESLETLVELSD